MDIDIRGELKEEFERQAEWRRLKASEHPGDSRNEAAAEIFDKLAASIKDLTPETLQVFGEIMWDDCQPEDSVEYQEMKRSVGFSWWPEDAEEFCKAVIADRTGNA